VVIAVDDGIVVVAAVADTPVVVTGNPFVIAVVVEVVVALAAIAVAVVTPMYFCHFLRSKKVKRRSLLWLGSFQPHETEHDTHTTVSRFIKTKFVVLTAEQNS
jgi:hypothetical protein